MRKCFNLLGKFLLGVLGIVLISSVPVVLFQISSIFDFSLYFHTVLEVSKSLVLPSQWSLSYFVIETGESIPISLGNYFKGPYLYSMTILIASLVFSLFVSFILAILTTISKGPIQKVLLKLANLLTAVPDFAYIFLIQIAVVEIYKMSGYRILSFYSLGGEVIYAAPVICLSVIPTILFYKLFVLLFNQEMGEPYVELARSKGLSKLEVLLRHCTSNVLQSVFFQSKSIVWLTLSSLFIIEYLFGIPGILHYLRNDFTPKGIAYILLSIFIPFFLFYTIGENTVKKGQREKSVLFEGLRVSFMDSLQWKNLFRYKTKKRVSIFAHLTQYMNITIPLMIVFCLLSVSVAYYFFYDDHVEQINFLYDENGSLIGRSPLPPSSSVLLGTDSHGYSIFQQLLVGTKYTIVLTLIVATVRVFGGYVFGFVYAFYLKAKWRKAINSIADGMHFLPLTLLMYILLLPILIAYSGEWQTTLWERLFIQVFIMSVLVLPITTSLIGNEMNEAIKKEYVQNSAVMGGSLIWIVLKHINPQIGRKLWLYWAQHIVQVLQTLVHLGVLSIFVGGAINFLDSPRLSREIYELSGMISISKEVFLTKQLWLIIPPLAIFMLLIFCFQKIADGISDKQLQSGGQKKRREIKWSYITRNLAKKTTK
jgi:peptide/nickel transport system permease protein